MSNVKTIGILGSGTWGVALARLLQRNGHQVTVWSKFQAEVDALNTTRVHPNLPGLTISDDIAFTSDMRTACQEKDILLFAVPSVFVRSTAALAAGISAGLGHGDNAKAGIITRGMAEIVRLGLAMGCSEQTFYGLAGIGDLIVTATSPHSRNNRCGMLIGQGVAPSEAVRQVGMVVEGINALPAAMQLAQRHNVDMPIVTGVNAVVNGLITPAEMALALMTRDKTSEVNANEMTVRFESALQRRRMHGETRRVLVGGTFPMLTAEEIVWLKNAKARGTWLAVALVDDGDQQKFDERRESLRALRCVDRVLPVSDWADLKDAVKNLRIDLIVARPYQVQQFANQEGLGVEVVEQ